MAASANPCGDNNNNSNQQQQEESAVVLSNGGGGANTNNNNNNNGISVPDNSVLGPTQAALRHNPGICIEWSSDEQSLLLDLLAKHASESNVVRYAKIAMQFKDKTVRDVALRCRWINRKENGKRRKDDHNSSRKNKDKKEKVADPSAKSSSQLTNHSSGPPYAQTTISMDCDDGISYKAIGGATGQLLEQNAQALDQISSNFGVFKIHDNINLFCQARNNILSILNDLNDLPEIMKQMPPLPVKLNEELANSILPRPLLHKKS